MWVRGLWHGAWGMRAGGGGGGGMGVGGCGLGMRYGIRVTWHEGKKHVICGVETACGYGTGVVGGEVKWGMRDGVFKNGLLWQPMKAPLEKTLPSSSP